MGMLNLRCAFVALRMDWCTLSSRRVIRCSIVKRKYLCIQLWEHCLECPLVKVCSLGFVSKHWNTIYNQFCYMFACRHIYFRLQLPLIIINITCISPSLRPTSAPIHLKIVLGVLGTQETSCILIAGLLERDIFDLYLPEIGRASCRERV